MKGSATILECQQGDKQQLQQGSQNQVFTKPFKFRKNQKVSDVFYARGKGLQFLMGFRQKWGLGLNAVRII